MPEANYALGNAYALQDDYPAALGAYDRALNQRPDWIEARENRARVAAMIPPPPEDAEPPGDAPPPNLPPDDVTFDERGEQGDRGEVPRELLSEEQSAELWLRRLQTSPADFLRRRFMIEDATRTEPE